MTKIERIDAEIMYANAILGCGNPHYFIYKVIESWDDEHLIGEMADMNLGEFEIEVEE